MNIRDMYAAEWCVAQQCGHFETLGEWVDETREKLLKGETQEWQLVGVYDDELTRNVDFSKFQENIISQIPEEKRLPITYLDF